VSVPPGTVVADGSSLPPLNFSLSEGFRTLPMLLAANAAQTTQDVLVTTVAPEIGAVGISNLKEVELEDGCMARDDDMAAAYEESFAMAHAEADEAVWLLDFYQDASEEEETWVISSVVGLSGPQSDALREVFGSVHYPQHLGRIHIRYEPGQLTADPAFYAHATSSFEAIEYVYYDADLTEFLPVCGEGRVDEGTCPPTERDRQYCTDDADGSARGDDDKGGCSSLGRVGGLTWLALPLVVLFGVRRQRRG